MDKISEKIIDSIIISYFSAQQHCFFFLRTKFPKKKSASVLEEFGKQTVQYFIYNTIS